MSEEKKESGPRAKTTGLVSLAILCSRILGLIRDQVLTGMFGSFFNGLFTAAFRTPNMLRDLFAEGALSTAFVTTFSKKMKTENDEAAWILARKMLTLSLCFMTIVAAAGVALAPYIVRLLNVGWVMKQAEGNLLPEGWTLERATELTIHLSQVMYPFIAIVSITALVMGMLNSKKVFFIPAVASAFFNLGCIFGGLLAAWIIDPIFRETGKVTETSLTGFAIGTLIGGVLQLAVQIPSLRKVGFTFGLDFKWKDQGVRDVLHLMWPSVIAASGTQVAVFLNSIFASFTPGQGSNLTWLGIAQRLQQPPLGLFVVAVAIVPPPTIPRSCASHRGPHARTDAWEPRWSNLGETQEVSRAEQVIIALRAVLPSDGLLVGTEQVRPYECDGLSAFRQLPLAVCLPQDEAQVAAVLQTCRAWDVPVVARGAGTSLSGGAMPHAAGVVLSLARLNRILDLDPQARTARVQPGVRNLAISEAAAPYSLYYAPDPSSQIACSIGGNIAENSGGVHCLKYGLTVHNVLQVRGLTIEGDSVVFGSAALDAPGLDLLALVIGSEGMLAVVTEVLVKLVPRPALAQVVMASFDDVVKAGDAVAAIIAAGIIPAGLEMMDRKATEAVEPFVKAGYDLSAEAIHLAEADGTPCPLYTTDASDE